MKFLIANILATLLCCATRAATVSDDFIRANTTASTDLSASIGFRWINAGDGQARIYNAEADVYAIGTYAIRFAMLNSAVGTLNDGAGTNFTLSAVAKMDTTDGTGYAGAIVNYVNSTNYYLLRYTGAGSVAFYRVVNGAATAISAANGTFTHVRNRPYELTVSSTDPYVFDLSIRDTVTDTVVYSKTGVVDTSSKFKDGLGGVYAGGTYVSFKKFFLETTTSGAAPGTNALLRLRSVVQAGEIQTEKMIGLSKDSFGRVDTGWQTNTTGLSAIGMYSNDWAVAAQSWKLDAGAVIMRRDSGNGFLVWQPLETANTQGRSFDLQATLMLGVTASTDWIGLAFNFQDTTNYYVLRYSGAGSVQFLRCRNGANTTFYSGSFTHTADHPYRLTIASSQAQTFDWSLTDGTNGSIVLSGVATDAGEGFSAGHAGIFGNSSSVRADDFRLQVNEALPVARTVKGTPMLLTQDGKNIAQDALCVNSNAVVRDEFRKATSNGLNIAVYTGVKLADTLDGFFVADKNSLDQGILNVLADNPQARIIIRTGGLHPPGSWYSYYTNEPHLHDSTNGLSGYPDPSSPIYLDVGAKCISNLVAYVEKQPYAGSVVGYHFGAFGGGEWQLPSGYWGYSDATRNAFQSWLMTKYSTVLNLNSAWGSNIASFATVDIPQPDEFTAADRGAFRDPVSRKNVIDFSEFWQGADANCLLTFCRAAKEASTNAVPPLTGAFYGYILETYQAFYTGHQALRKVLDSPYIDFLAAPYSYVYRVPTWLGVTNADIGAGAFHGPVDSILSNGKLFYTEDDGRTYLTTNRTDSHFTTVAETVAGLRRNQLASLSRGAGIWRLDLFSEGWFNSTEIMQELGLQKHLNELVVPDQDYAPGYTPDAALIIDEASSFYVATKSTTDALSKQYLGMFLRDHLQRGGVNCGVYLLSDLIAGRVPDCSVYLFAGTYRITRSERNWIDENLKRNGKTLVWFYGSGLYDETGWGLDRMSDLIGLNIAEAAQTTPSNMDPTTALSATVSNPGTGSALSGQPEWYVANLPTGATTLANYTHGLFTKNPAFVMADKSDWHTVYIGAQHLNPEWALGLMRLIGVHQYLDTDATVPCYAGHGIIGIWPTVAMSGTVRLKGMSDVYDLFTGQRLYQSVSNFPVNLTQWKISGYKIKPAGTPWLPGMFYQWQTNHFNTSDITTGLAAEQLDADGDGDSNYYEFIAGTNPTNALSRFAMQMSRTTNQIGTQLAFNTATGRTYLLYTRTNLLYGTWIPLSTSSGSGTNVLVTVTNGGPVGFYRLDVRLP